MRDVVAQLQQAWTFRLKTLGCPTWSIQLPCFLCSIDSAIHFKTNQPCYNRSWIQLSEKKLLRPGPHDQGVLGGGGVWGELLARLLEVGETSCVGGASLFSAAHLGTQQACLQIRAPPWTGGWQRIQVAGGDKTASGTLQMQALAERRLDGEQGKLRPLIMLPVFTAARSRTGHLEAREVLRTNLCSPTQIVGGTPDKKTSDSIHY